MSKLTQAHYELARHARWHLGEICAFEGVSRDDFEICGVVENYHRKDRYRNLYASGRNQRVLQMLMDRIQAKATGMTGVRIHIEITKARKSRIPAVLSVSIWPDLG